MQSVLSGPDLAKQKKEVNYPFLNYTAVRRHTRKLKENLGNTQNAVETCFKELANYLLAIRRQKIFLITESDFVGEFVNEDSLRFLDSLITIFSDLLSALRQSIVKTQLDQCNNPMFVEIAKYQKQLLELFLIKHLLLEKEHGIEKRIKILDKIISTLKTDIPFHIALEFELTCCLRILRLIQDMYPKGSDDFYVLVKSLAIRFFENPLIYMGRILEKKRNRFCKYGERLCGDWYSQLMELEEMAYLSINVKEGSVTVSLEDLQTHLSLVRDREAWQINYRISEILFEHIRNIQVSLPICRKVLFGDYEETKKLEDERLLSYILISFCLSKISCGDDVFIKHIYSFVKSILQLQIIDYSRREVKKYIQSAASGMLHEINMEGSVGLIHNFLKERPLFFMVKELCAKELPENVPLGNVSDGSDSFSSDSKMSANSESNALSRTSSNKLVPIGDSGQPLNRLSAIEVNYSDPCAVAAYCGLGFIGAEGDGNCFFHAMVTVMRENFEEEYTHQDLRDRAVNYFRDHPELQIGFVNDEEQQAYMVRMMQEEIDAEGPVIQAMFLALNVRVTLLEARGDSLNIMHENEGAPEHRRVCIVRSDSPGNPPHYDACIGVDVPEAILFAQSVLRDEKKLSGQDAGPDSEPREPSLIIPAASSDMQLRETNALLPEFPEEVSNQGLIAEGLLVAALGENPIHDGLDAQGLPQSNIETALEDDPAVLSDMLKASALGTQYTIEDSGFKFEYVVNNKKNDLVSMAEKYNILRNTGPANLEEQKPVLWLNNVDGPIRNFFKIQDFFNFSHKIIYNIQDKNFINIQGRPGVGKTTLAIRHLCANSFLVGWIVNAETEETFYSDVFDLMAALGIRHMGLLREVNKICEIFKTPPIQISEWKIIIDNITNNTKRIVFNFAKFLKEENIKTLILINDESLGDWLRIKPDRLSRMSFLPDYKKAMSRFSKISYHHSERKSVKNPENSEGTITIKTKETTYPMEDEALKRELDSLVEFSDYSFWLIPIVGNYIKKRNQKNEFSYQDFFEEIKKEFRIIAPFFGEDANDELLLKNSHYFSICAISLVIKLILEETGHDGAKMIFFLSLLPEMVLISTIGSYAEASNIHSKITHLGILGITFDQTACYCYQKTKSIIFSLFEKYFFHINQNQERFFSKVFCNSLQTLRALYVKNKENAIRKQYIAQMECVLCRYRVDLSKEIKLIGFLYEYFDSYKLILSYYSDQEDMNALIAHVNILKEKFDFFYECSNKYEKQELFRLMAGLSMLILLKKNSYYYDVAADILEKSLALMGEEKDSDEPLYFECKRLLGCIFLRQGKFPLAKQHFFEGIKFILDPMLYPGDTTVSYSVIHGIKEEDKLFFLRCIVNLSHLDREVFRSTHGNTDFLNDAVLKLLIVTPLLEDEGFVQDWSGTVFWARRLLGSIYKKLRNFKEAFAILWKNIQELEQKIKVDYGLYLKKSLAKNYFLLSKVLCASGDVLGARIFVNKSLNMHLEVFQPTNRYIAKINDYVSREISPKSSDGESFFGMHFSFVDKSLSAISSVGTLSEGDYDESEIVFRLDSGLCSGAPSEEMHNLNDVRWRDDFNFNKDSLIEGTKWWHDCYRNLTSCEALDRAGDCVDEPMATEIIRKWPDFSEALKSCYVSLLYKISQLTRDIPENLTKESIKIRDILLFLDEWMPDRYHENLTVHQQLDYNYWDMVATYFSARFCNSQFFGRDEEAENFISIAISIRERFPYYSSAKLVDCYVRKAYHYIVMGKNFGICKVLLDRSQSILDIGFSSGTELFSRYQRAKLLNYYGIFLAITSLSNESREQKIVALSQVRSYFSRAREEWQNIRNLGKNPTHKIATSEANLGQAYLESYFLEQKERDLLTSKRYLISANKKFSDIESVDATDTKRNLARAYMVERRFPDAIELMEEAVKIYSNIFGQYHRGLIPFYELLMKCCKSLHLEERTSRVKGDIIKISSLINENKAFHQKDNQFPENISGRVLEYIQKNKIKVVFIEHDVNSGKKLESLKINLHIKYFIFIKTMQHSPVFLWMERSPTDGDLFSENMKVVYLDPAGLPMHSNISHWVHTLAKSVRVDTPFMQETYEPSGINSQSPFQRRFYKVRDYSDLIFYGFLLLLRGEAVSSEKIHYLKTYEGAEVGGCETQVAEPSVITVPGEELREDRDEFFECDTDSDGDRYESLVQVKGLQENLEQYSDVDKNIGGSGLSQKDREEITAKSSQRGMFGSGAIPEVIERERLGNEADAKDLMPEGVVLVPAATTTVAISPIRHDH